MKVNKKLTLGEVEQMRSDMNTSIAEAIQKFESDTGMRIGYIETVRSKDQSENGCNCCKPMTYDEDRGDVVTVNANMNMDL